MSSTFSGTIWIVLTQFSPKTSGSTKTISPSTASTSMHSS